MDAAHKSSYKILYFFLLSMFVLIGCGPETNDTHLSPSSDGGYPSIIDSNSTTIEPYPISTSNPNDILIGLNKPIRAGDTTVTGYGPAGLPIQIINITFMGEELGAGIIEEDGTFSITVEPISEGIRIGLSVNLNSVNLSNNDVVPGSEAINIPQVGYFIDSFVIK